MHIAFKYEIFPTAEQRALLPQLYGNVRFVWNKALEMRRKVHDAYGYWPNYEEMAAWLPGWKVDYPFLELGDSTSYQQTLLHLSKAIKDYFKSKLGLRKGPKLGFPKRKRRKNRWSYKTVSKSVKIENGKIYLPKLDLVEIRQHRPLQGKFVSATVSTDKDGRCFVSICCNVNKIESLPKTGRIGAFDLGLKNYATSNEGEKYQGYKLNKKTEDHLVRLSQNLSRKTKGSKNWNKARIRLAKAYSKERKRREDTLHKLSLQLVKEYDIIALEKLNVQSMVNRKKRKIKRKKTGMPEWYYRQQAKSIANASWSRFASMMQYKAEWYGKKVVFVEAAYTSQTCHKCGYVNEAVADLKVRNWTCPHCGARHDRDINAAKNILQRALQPAPARTARAACPQGQENAPLEASETV
ncbi:MAG: transposase [Actinomycetaceae bacterium]|nr:transposase [Actinomycetaceae bacterium]